MIKYQVSLENANKHVIDVKLTLDFKLISGQEFWLPDWIPGSYMIRDFSKNLITLNAETNGTPIDLPKKSKSCWVLEQDVDQLQLQYQIYAWDLSVRSAHFDDLHCFFNGTSLFLAVAGQENHTHFLTLDQPKNNCFSQWQVASSMPFESVCAKGFGQYFANSYAELIDHPFEIADFIETHFEVDGIPHRMIFAEAPQVIDLNRIAADVKRICEYECRFFGDKKPPFSQFLFMTFVQKNGFGGLEHSSSTALHCSHDDLPRIGDDAKTKSEGYQKFLSLCCHEYFHCWNVKRIKPARFEAYQLKAEVHTELLWFFEGITSYYDELFLLRSGVISKEDYLDMIGKNITRYIRGKGRQKQTIAQSSFDAWSKFYKQDENAPNAIVSYYVKGGLVAFCLDFEIRKITKNRKNLDDLMRAVWTQFGKSSRGVQEKDIQLIAEELVGESMADFFNQILYSTEELALEALFESLGIKYQLAAETKQTDKGGFRQKPIETKTVCSLSLSHRHHPSGAEIISVFDDGCASQMGLSNKDIIIAVDGYRVLSKELDKTIAKYPIDSKVEISFFRRDKLHHRTAVLTASVNRICYLSFEKEQINSRFKDWIKT